MGLAAVRGVPRVALTKGELGSFREGSCSTPDPEALSIQSLIPVRIGMSRGSAIFYIAADHVAIKSNERARRPMDVI
jgi:hypothetical protein